MFTTHVVPHKLHMCATQGRKYNAADHDWNDIVMRRSTDSGQTWSSIAVIHSESNATKHVTIGNPAPIVDLTTG